MFCKKYRTTKISHFRFHFALQHEKIEEIVKCEICKVGFFSCQALSQHKKICQKVTKVNENVTIAKDSNNLTNLEITSSNARENPPKVQKLLKVYKNVPEADSVSSRFPMAGSESAYSALFDITMADLENECTTELETEPMAKKRKNSEINKDSLENETVNETNDVEPKVAQNGNSKRDKWIRNCKCPLTRNCSKGSSQSGTVNPLMDVQEASRSCVVEGESDVFNVEFEPCIPETEVQSNTDNDLACSVCDSLNNPVMPNDK